MNGKFEQSSAYPYSVQPIGGYGKGSDRWEVIDIRNGTVVSTGHASAVDAALALPAMQGKAIPQTQQRQA